MFVSHDGSPYGEIPTATQAHVALRQVQQVMGIVRGARNVLGAEPDVLPISPTAAWSWGVGAWCQMAGIALFPGAAAILLSDSARLSRRVFGLAMFTNPSGRG